MLPEVNNTFPTEFNKDRIKSVLSTVTYKKNMLKIEMNLGFRFQSF